MKKTIRILLPIFLGVSIIACAVWYLFSYDREFTRDVLLYGARMFEKKGNHEAGTKLYDLAYKQASDNDQVAIELADQYIKSGNYTKAEYVLNQAIAEGGSEDLYIALSKIYVDQDKILDAVKLLDAVCREDSTIDPAVKEALINKRPDVPVSPTEQGTYNQYVSITLESKGNSIYANTRGEIPSVKTDLYTSPLQTVLGENTICIVAISKEGLVSPKATFKYIIGGVIEEVIFADSEVEKAAHTLLNIPETKVIMTNDLWEITEFTMPANAKDYSDLKHMKNLEKLTIASGAPGQLSVLSSLTLLNELSVTDVSVSADELAIISSLPSLKILTLSGCKLSSITGLNKASRLTYLDLSKNTIRNISDISVMKNLTDLNLSQNAISDLSSLSACSSLSVLDVSGNALTTLSSACDILSLKELKADKNLIAQLGEVSKLTSLETLTLSYNQIADVTALGSCASIRTLDLSNNTLTDISALSSLSGLEHLNFAQNGVLELPAWSENSALISIDGTKNQISDLTPLSVLKFVNFITMDYNSEIESVDMLATCNMLAVVSVYGTKVDDLTKIEVLHNLDIVVHYSQASSTEESE